MAEQPLTLHLEKIKKTFRKIGSFSSWRKQGKKIELKLFRGQHSARKVAAESSKFFSRRSLITAFAKRLLRASTALFLGKRSLHKILLKGGLMNELPMIETSDGGKRIASGKKQHSLPGVMRRIQREF